MSQQLEPPPVCVICGARATHRPVRTGQSWFDSVPFLAWINSLQSMPRRCIVVCDAFGPLKYCVSCQGNAVSKLRQTHARIRSDYAQFNAEKDAELTALDQGGLDLILQADHAAMREQINRVARWKPNQTIQTKQLEADIGVHVTAAASIGSDEP